MDFDYNPNLYDRIIFKLRYVPCSTEYLKGRCDFCEGRMKITERLKRIITKYLKL